MEVNKQVIISCLKDVKYLARFAWVNFNYDELEVTLDQNIKDLRIIYEIVDNYLTPKPAQTLPPQTLQQPAPCSPQICDRRRGLC